jgi:hypothetical protein
MRDLTEVKNGLLVEPRRADIEWTRCVQRPRRCAIRLAPAAAAAYRRLQH